MRRIIAALSCLVFASVVAAQPFGKRGHHHFWKHHDWRENRRMYYHGSQWDDNRRWGDKKTDLFIERK